MSSVYFRILTLSKLLLSLACGLLLIPLVYASESCLLPDSQRDTFNIDSANPEAEINEPLKNLTPPAEPVDWQALYPDATQMHALETRYTPSSADFIGKVSVAETESMLSRLRRYGSWASEGLTALGPVFDAIALGAWMNNIVTTFSNQQSTELDKVASGLFLVPIVGDLARDLASADHVNTQIERDIARIKQEHHYLYTDSTANARALATKIQQIITLKSIWMQQFLTNFQLMIDTQIITAMSHHQNYALAWISTLNKTLQHLDDQVFKHIVYQLYQSPYQLDQDVALSRLPLQCESSSLHIHQHAPKNQAAITQKLVTCLQQTLTHNLTPLADLLNQRHPHFSLSTWSHLAEDMRRIKAAMIHQVKDKIATHQAQTLTQLQQHFAQIKLNQMPYQAELARISEQLKQLSFLRWQINEFSNIPSDQLHFNSDNLTALISPKKSCTSLPTWLKWVPPFIDYCALSQWLTNMRYPPKTVAFYVYKDNAIQTFYGLTARFNHQIMRLHANAYTDAHFKQGYGQKDVNTLLQPTMPAIAWLSRQSQSKRQIYLKWLQADSPTPVPALEQVFAKARTANTHLLTLKGYQKLIPIWYQELLSELQHTDDVTSVSANMHHLFKRYPWNQTWFLQKNGQQLGAFKALLLFQNLKEKDQLQQIRLVNQPSLKLPRKLTHWLSTNDALTPDPDPSSVAQSLNRVLHLTAKLSMIPQQNCQWVKRIQKPLHMVTNSAYTVLPFWYHIFNEIQHQYQNYATVIRPYCEQP